LAFAGLASSALGKANAGVLTPTTKDYGPLVPDPKKLLDLPQGFSYQVISELGDAMSDGLNVPDRADGITSYRPLTYLSSLNLFKLILLSLLMIILKMVSRCQEAPPRWFIISIPRLLKKSLLA